MGETLLRSMVTPGRLVRWLVILLAVPPLVLVPAPGWSFSGDGTERSCTARPGSVCRCPQWRRDAGVCCCSKGAVRPPSSCCSVKSSTGRSSAQCSLGDKNSSAKAGRATCCSSERTSATGASSRASLHERPTAPVWQACPCGDDGTGGFSLVAKPRMAVASQGYCPIPVRRFVTGHTSQDAPECFNSPEDPPPRHAA